LRVFIRCLPTKSPPICKSQTGPSSIATLNGREIGNLLAAVDGRHWLDKRNAATLAHILGHDNLTTTARYLHPNMAGVAEL
jgi:hypothetical protein